MAFDEGGKEKFLNYTAAKGFCCTSIRLKMLWAHKNTHKKELSSLFALEVYFA